MAAGRKAYQPSVQAIKGQGHIMRPGPPAVSDRVRRHECRRPARQAPLVAEDMAEVWGDGKGVFAVGILM